MAADMDCKSLLRKIQELQFVAIELNLYLDTHPNERAPLEQYNRVSKELMELHHQYIAAYGPLVNFGHGEEMGNTWRWAETPWPWEM